MLKPIWIVGFTGHRPGSGPGRSTEALDACLDSVRQVLAGLRDQAAERGGTVELVCSVAAGADLRAAEVARDMDIPVHVLLPTPESMFGEDFRPDFEDEWKRAKALIDEARQRVGGGTIRVAEGDNARPDCYHEANLQLLKSCDVLVAVWNGEPVEGKGGTAEVVEEAERLGIPVTVINPARFGSVELRGEWVEQPGDRLLKNLSTRMAALGEPPPRGEDERDGEGPAWRLFKVLDETAKQSGRNFRGSLIRSMYLHFLAALLAACTAAFSPVFSHDSSKSHGEKSTEEVEAKGEQESHGEEDDHPAQSGHEPPEAGPKLGSDVELEIKQVWKDFGGKLVKELPKAMTSVELFLVCIALGLMLYAGARHTHEGWRESRFAAEVAHGLIMSGTFLDPLRPLVARHNPEWRRFALSVSFLAYRSTPLSPDIETAKESYRSDRVLNQSERYFRKEQPGVERSQHWLSLVSKLAGMTAPAFIGIALYYKWEKPDEVESNYFVARFALLFPVVLPLLAGAATSLIVATDVGRRSERYRVMGERLGRIAELIPGLQTRGALSRIVSETEEILLDELIEWYAAAKTIGH